MDVGRLSRASARIGFVFMGLAAVSGCSGRSTPLTPTALSVSAVTPPAGFTTGATVHPGQWIWLPIRRDARH